MFHLHSKTTAKFIFNTSTKALGLAFVASFASATYYRPVLDRSETDTAIAADHGETDTSASASTLTSTSTSTLTRTISRTTASCTTGTLTSSDDNHNDNDKNNGQLLQQQQQQSTAAAVAAAGPNRNEEFFASKENPSSFSDRDKTPFWLSVAQHISISITTIAIRIFMNTYGTYDIVNDEHYHYFVSLVVGRRISKDGSNDSNHSNHSNHSNNTGDKARNTSNKRGLLTVSNHRSLFDDPGVVSCLLPLHLGIQPKLNRWGICSQEYCFNDKLPPFIKGYLGAGQVLPIKRGGGIDQELFRHFASFLSHGEWCHIFPEGGVWQCKELGGRGRDHSGVIIDKNRNRNRNRNRNVAPRKNGNISSTTSKLKWGVGKLIAHAPIRPHVIPFAHVGMENILPANPVTGKTEMKKHFFGGEPLRVHVRFGEEIHFDDLIEEHEKAHGSLWTYGGGEKANVNQWISSESEKVLYHKIALRIEEHMEILTEKVVCREK